MAICLGDGHEHGPAEVEAQHCELACAHESDWPAPVPADDGDRCGCTDIELSLTDLPWARTGTDDGVVLAPPGPAAILTLVPAWAIAPPVVAPPDDPPRVRGQRHRYAIVHATRLLV